MRRSWKSDLQLLKLALCAQTITPPVGKDADLQQRKSGAQGGSHGDESSQITFYISECSCRTFQMHLLLYRSRESLTTCEVKDRTTEVVHKWFPVLVSKHHRWRKAAGCKAAGLHVIQSEAPTQTQRSRTRLTHFGLLSGHLHVDDCGCG